MVEEALDGDTAVWAAEILAVGEVVGVGGEQVDVVRVPTGDGDLGLHRVGLEVHAHGHASMLITQHRRARDVDERVGFLEEPRDARFGQAENPAVRWRCPIGPAIREAVARHHLTEIADGIAAVVGDRVLVGVVGPRARVLDVVDVHPQPTEPLEEVHELPGDARDRHAAGDSEHDQPHSPTDPETASSGTGGAATTRPAARGSRGACRTTTYRQREGRRPSRCRRSRCRGASGRGRPR
jgi:hypothetical protein